MKLQTQFDYQMFLAILTGAEARVKAYALIDPQVARLSAETVALCEERMQAEGLTRAEVKRRANGRAFAAVLAHVDKEKD